MRFGSLCGFIMLVYCCISMSECIKFGQIDNLGIRERHHFFVLRFDFSGRCDIWRLDLCLIGHAKRLPTCAPGSLRAQNAARRGHSRDHFLGAVHCKPGVALARAARRPARHRALAQGRIGHVSLALDSCPSPALPSSGSSACCASPGGEGKQILRHGFLRERPSVPGHDVRRRDGHGGSGSSPGLGPRCASWLGHLRLRSRVHIRSHAYLRAEDGCGLHGHDLDPGHQHQLTARWIAFLGYACALFLLVGNA